VTAEVEAHETTTSMAKAPLAEVHGSTDMALKVKVSCSSGCDLWGGTVKITAQDGAVAKEAVLVSFDGSANQTDEFMVKAPFEPGEYTWTALFPARERKGILHEESSAPFSFVVKQHATSAEVWDVPSPIAVGEEFRINVGVKCSAHCNLAGQGIEIYDHQGAKVATGALGDVPRPGTPALYWAEVDLKAPGIEGRHRWTVKFPEPDLELTHEEASCAFAFVTGRQPECVVTIQVVDKDTETPNENAQVRLRPRMYRGSTYLTRTDEGGVARLKVPRGTYQLYVWGDEYEKIVPSVKVDSDLTIKAALSDPLSSWRQFPR